MEAAFILATALSRAAAAWLALRLHRRRREVRFAIVTFVLAVSAVFPLAELAGNAPELIGAHLREAANGLAVLLTALVLVRTLTDLLDAYEEIQQSNEELDARVRARTAELSEANESLANEVRERRRAEEALRLSEAAVRRSEAELRRLAARLIEAQEDERRRLARELHDGSSQTLAALALELANLRHRSVDAGRSLRDGLEHVEGSVHKLAEDIHDLSRLLHPSILDDLGLVAAVRAECDRFAEREGIPLDFQTRDVPEKLPPDCALTLYRITQEALRNIARHAGSRDAHVTLLGEDDAVTLEIEDSGRGFDVEAARTDGGLGLVSMHERVRLIGGVLDVDSRPGRGTRIRVEAPIRAATEPAANEPLEGVEYAQTASAAG